MNDLEASDADLSEQLAEIETELAQKPEPPAGDPGVLFGWAEDVYLDALEGACFATELGRLESVNKLLGSVARAAEVLLSVGNDAAGEEDDRSAANAFTFVQGLCAALVIGDQARAESMAALDPSQDALVGQVLIEFAQVLRKLALRDDAGALAALEPLLNMSPEDMELEDLYWFRLGKLLQAVLSKASLDEPAADVAYVHQAVYSAPDLEEDPGAFLALPLQAVRAEAHKRGHPFEFPEDLDPEVLEALLDDYEGEIDLEALEPLVRTAAKILLAGDPPQKAYEAILAETKDEEFAGGLAADVTTALQLVVGDDEGDDTDIDDETTVDDLAKRLVEEGIPEPAAYLILQVIADEIDAGDGDDSDD